jgi:hypothetical protein
MKARSIAIALGLFIVGWVLISWLVGCTVERGRGRQYRWGWTYILEIQPSHEGSGRSLVMWMNDQKDIEPELIDTTGLGYHIGLKRLTLIQR